MATPFPRPSRTDPAARIKALQAIARHHKGRCLTREYLGLRQLLELVCAEGHEFSITPEKVFDGYWCGECLRRGPAKLKAVQALARERGGVCLSKQYARKSERMKFRCGKGHEWETTMAQIQRGRWCPRCSGRQVTIEHMQEFAAREGGRCLSRRYDGHRSPLRWQCAEGHVFRMLPVSVKIGGWCPRCRGRPRKPLLSPPPAMQRAIKIAVGRGGALVSTPVAWATDPSLWRCAAGHEWLAPATSITTNRWCAACHCLTIAEMQAIARERSGKCLSPTYVNSGTKLEWECEHGHRWWASPANIKYRGSWCPECGVKARRGARKDRR